MDEKRHDELVREFYDDTAQSWADNWYNNDSMLPLLEDFVSRLPASPRVLDLGCGAGYESMRLARLGARVTGVDLSPRSIEIARERNPDIEFHCMNMLEIDDRLGLFDGVIAIASLLHVPEERLPLAMRAIRDRLHPGGCLLAVFSAGEGGYSKERSVAAIDGKVYDRRFYKHRPEVLTEAAAAGFLFAGERPVPGDSTHGNWKAYLFQRKEEA